ELKPNTTVNGDTNNSCSLPLSESWSKGKENKEVPQPSHSPRGQRPEFANNPKCDGNEYAGISVIPLFTDDAKTSNLSSCPHSSTYSPMRSAMESLKGGRNLSSHTESMDKNRQIMGMMSTTIRIQGTGTSCDKSSLTFEGSRIGNNIKSFVSSTSVPVVLRSLLFSSGGTHIHRISANPYISVSTQSLKHHMTEWLYLRWKHMRIKGRISLMFGSIVVKSKTLSVPSRLDYIFIVSSYLQDS
ncbi:620_t:CDS:2, partial [Rhizophagus irregularis]